LLGVEGSLFTSETLVDDFCVLVDLQVLDGVGVGQSSDGGGELSCLVSEHCGQAVRVE
jgi:hypothetical protein